MNPADRTPDKKAPECGASLEGFCAELEVFSGPLDLLLHLVKQNEVDVLEIPLSRITDQYLQVLRAMQMFDVNVAAEFLVMAATLMDIKSRSLLPEPPQEDEEEPDPRDELVRQLLRYRLFKEASGCLGRMAARRALRFGRAPVELPAPPERVRPERLLGNVTVWDLVSAYGEVLRQIRPPQQVRIVYDDVPISLYMEEVMGRLAEAGGPVEFLEFFTPGTSRARCIGIFLALLELLARGRVVLAQPDGDRAHITIALARRAEAG